MGNITKLEEATFRLDCWNALAGWGTLDEKNKPVPWNFDERLAKANELANALLQKRTAIR